MNRSDNFFETPDLAKLLTEPNENENHFAKLLLDLYGICNNYNPSSFFDAQKKTEQLRKFTKKSFNEMKNCCAE